MTAVVEQSKRKQKLARSGTAKHMHVHVPMGTAVLDAEMRALFTTLRTRTRTLDYMYM